MSRIKEIGHAVLHVGDVDVSTDWYCDVLGMEVVVAPPRFRGRFLSFGRRDHDIALFERGDVEGAGGREYNHLAFELDGDLADLKAFRRRLLEKGVTITGTVDHGISFGIYFLDPDGHQLEVFLQRTAVDADPKQVFRELGAFSTPIDLDAVQE